MPRWLHVCLYASLCLSNLPLKGQNGAGQPVIFNASQTAFAGDVIYLQGSGFGNSPYVRYAYNDSNWSTVPVTTSGSDAALVQMPASQTRLPDLLAMEISPDGFNWSAPVYINQARALSFDTSQVAPGSSFRVFGRNLMFSRTPTVRMVDAADGSSHQASVNSATSQSYVLSVTAPTDVQPNHQYSVYVSNGYSGNAMGNAETVAALTLQGRTSGTDYWSLGVPWAADLSFANNVYNVQSDARLSQHATGTGSPSDLSTIAAAIWTASNAGGGIVYLPAGTYDLQFSSGCGLTLPSHVSLMGGGATSTTVNYGYGTAPAPGQGGYAVCIANASQSGASDITFNNLNQSGNWPQTAAILNSNEVFLQRTNWNLANAQWLVMQNNTNIAVENSTITQGVDPSYNGPLCLLNNQNLSFRGNTVKYVDGEVDFDGVVGGVVENNTFIRDASQSVPAWVVTHVITGNFTRDFMVLNNKFEVTGGTLPTVNNGETIGTEAGGAVRRDEFRGVVQSATATSIYDGNQNFNYSTNNAIPCLHVGAILAIVGGTGAGQWATITAISSDGHTLQVDKPWAVTPASGSRYSTFDWSASNWIVASNTLSDNEKGIEFFQASIRDILVTNNAMTNNGEILVSPEENGNGAGLFNLVLNTQILNNTLIDNNHLRPAAISAVSREDGQVSNVGTAIIGMEIRGNSITASTPNTYLEDASLDDQKALSEGFNVYWQWQTNSDFQDDGTPSILGTVIQNNTLNNSLAALETNSAVSQTVLAGNTFNNVGSAIVDQVVPGDTHGSIETTTIAPPSPQAISAPLVWNQLTIGSAPANTLTAQPASNTSFLLAPSEYQIGVGPDSLSVLAQQISPSDVVVQARISVPASASPATRGLLVFRADQSSTGAFFAFGLSQNGEVIFQWRACPGCGVSGYTLQYGQAPVWVKVTKTGNDFEAFFSADGANWQYGGLVGADFWGEYYVGLESLSDSLTAPSVLFDNVNVP